MTLSVGDRITDVTVMRMTGEGPFPVASAEVLGRGTVALVAVPGAFTPVCSDQHLVGAENPVTSCDLDVLVKEAAEPVSSERPDDDCGTWSTTALGRALMQ